MSFSVAARPALRRSAYQARIAARRFESSNAADKAREAASKAADTAAEYRAKAAQGLSRVSSSAGPAIAGAARGMTNALGRVGGRTGRLVGFVERQVPWAVYYSRVGLELSKLVFRGQNMTPPPLSTFQAYFQSVLKQVQNPSSLISSASAAAQQPANLVQRARNVSPTQLVSGGILLAECLGFFTVGEMIGRFKLIGYHGQAAGAHH